jgi:hypothetical protein
LEARIASIDHEGQAIDAEGVFRPEASAKTIVRNAIAVITTTLPPVAVVGIPAL